MSSAVRKLCLILILLGGVMSVRGALSAEEKEFGAAAQAFQDRSWAQAERAFASYREKFPKAANLAQAVKFQAEARIGQKNYPGAIELLNAGLPAAGQWRDEYLFWRAEAHFRSGAMDVAAEQFALFAVEFPGATRAMAGLLREAEARARLDQWEHVVNLLQRPDGLFQSRMKSEPTSPDVARGSLLLAEALLSLGRVQDSEAALAVLGDATLDPDLLLHRNFHQARIHVAGGRVKQSLALLTNLPALATNQNLFTLAADALGLAGQVHAKAGRVDDAIATWRQILALPVSERRREIALGRTAELLLSLNRDAEAILVLENILQGMTNSPITAVAWLTLGELRLRSHMAATALGATNGAAAISTATNLLPLALSNFGTVIEQFTNSPFVAKAQLGRGWCLWLEGNLTESRAAFQQAATTLTRPMDRAVALFKLGDVLAAQKESAAALTSYKAVVTLAGLAPEVRTNLAERALYQVVRTAREAGDTVSESAAMGELLNQFPNGFLAQKTLMSLGGTSNQDGDATESRGIFEGFIRNTPDSPLLPLVQLAVVRTYEQEREWAKAESAYAQWLDIHTNHPAAPRAEYFRALAMARSGGETNALQLFTEFVSRHPTNEFVPLAQRWAADHFWRQDDFVNAELNYQQLAVNHPTSALRFEALLMAGRAALARDNPMAAIPYFTNLTSDANCPAKEAAQALFATGDCYMGLNGEGTNQMRTNLFAAMKRFGHIIEKYPATEISVLAQGRLADCYWNLGNLSESDSGQFTNAAAAYQSVLTNSMADAMMRWQAEFGLGQLDERQAQMMRGANEATFFLGRALQHYLNIVSQDDETMDMTWVKRAGLQALAVAESLQDWEHVAGLCERLGELLPTERANLEKKKARAEQARAQARDAE